MIIYNLSLLGGFFIKKMPRRQGLTFFLPGEKSKQKTPRRH